MFFICSYSGVVESILPNGTSWQIRSSSRRKPAKQKTSAPPLVFVMERFSRPRAICSICSNQKMSFRNGSAGRRYFCAPKVFTALAPQRVETKPPSSKPFARHSILGRAGLARHRLRSRGPAYRSGDPRALRVPWPSDAGAVHRAGRTDYPRCIRSGKIKYGVWPFYAAAVARRQADQIYNLSLTRTATVILGRGARRVIGVGRVKTPTLAIVRKREL